MIWMIQFAIYNISICVAEQRLVVFDITPQHMIILNGYDHEPFWIFDVDQWPQREWNNSSIQTAIQQNQFMFKKVLASAARFHKHRTIKHTHDFLLAAFICVPILNMCVRSLERMNLMIDPDADNIAPLPFNNRVEKLCEVLYKRKIHCGLTICGWSQSVQSITKKEHHKKRHKQINLIHEVYRQLNYKCPGTLYPIQLCKTGLVYPYNHSQQVLVNQYNGVLVSNLISINILLTC